MAQMTEEDFTKLCNVADAANQMLRAAIARKAGHREMQEHRKILKAIAVLSDRYLHGTED